MTRIDKNGEEITKNIFHIDSARFMGSSLSNFVNNLYEGIHKSKCKYGHYDKNVKLLELHTKYATVFLNIRTLKMI